MGTLAGGKETGQVWRAPLGPLFCPLAPRSLQLPQARTDRAAGCLTTTRSRPLASQPPLARDLLSLFTHPDLRLTEGRYGFQKPAICFSAC